jgi:hypothetical protein
MCADLSKSHLEQWDSQIRSLVGEWFGIENIPVGLFQMSWSDEGFLLKSAWAEYSHRPDCP